jgi:hypothetical protein
MSGTTRDGRDALLTYDQRGPTVKASGKMGSTRWRLSAVKQRKAAVCAALRSGSPLGNGPGLAKDEDGALPQTANPASFSSSYVSSGGMGKGNPNRLGFEPPASAGLK